MQRKHDPRKKIVTALTIAIVVLMFTAMPAGEAGAYKQADVDRLLRTRHCGNCDLTRADLSQAQLDGVDLKWAKLVNANLTGAQLNRADLTGAILYNTELVGAHLINANLSAAYLEEAKLTQANLSGADLSGAYLGGATWTDGSTCEKGSIGQCIKQAPWPPPDGGSTSCTDPKNCKITISQAAAATYYVVVFDGDNLLCVIDANDVSVTVPEGLRYGGTYEYYLISFSATDEFIDYIGPGTLTVGPRPPGVDDYGNPTTAQTIKGSDGSSITLADNKLSTLIASGGPSLPQTPLLTSLQNAGGVIADNNGQTITINTNDMHVARVNGGQGGALVMAASDTSTINTIKPLTSSGYSMDASGNLNPDVSVNTTGVNLPLGLFDFTVILDASTNCTNVVIVPPTPLAPSTKWYKVINGSLVEYPNFQVDSSGNGILTLYDNDDYDQNPAWGMIRDPGGPGIASTSITGGGGSGCFIATAAYGSYFHPFVKVLRAFRDSVLLTSSFGRSFVSRYYRVSPPIADVIKTSTIMKAGVRLMLLPAVGIAWLTLKVGAVPVVLMFIVLGAALLVTARMTWRRT